VLKNVPELVVGRASDIERLWQRARPAQALERRVLQLDAFDSQMEQAATAFYSERERVLDDARHSLARVRSRVPRPDTLDLPAQQLQAAAKHFFTAREAEVDAAAASLAGARSRVPTADDINALAARLGPAAARARRRAHDYERALTRLRREADRTFTRRLREHQRELATAGQALTSAARRVLADATTRLAHVVELIAAKDFRRAGWVLVGDASGRPVHSVADIAAGDELHLHFHDGVADAAITNVSPEKGDTHG